MTLSTPTRRVARRSPAPSLRLLASALLLLLSPAWVRAAEPSPEAPRTASQALVEGLWVGPTGGGDNNVFQLTLEAGRLTGHGFLVRDGKAVVEIPVVVASVEAPAGGGVAGAAAPPMEVELRLRTGWTFRGRLSADGTELVGELDLGQGRRQELHLRRRPPGAVPAILPRPPVAPGEPSYVYRRPAEAGDGWTTADAALVGPEVPRIEALVGDVLAGEAGLIHSLLLVKGGSLVVEEYFHGFGRDDLHVVNSCTKSIASLLVGLAIQSGRLPGVEARLLELFPGEGKEAAPGWEDLRIRHLLTMTSGACPPAGGPPPAGPALVRAVLANPPASPVGERWRYSDLDADLLAAVLHRATGMHADVYAGRYLFGPLGIERWDWEMGRTDGFPRLYGTLRLRSRDLAKIGALVLAGGRWRGRQVVAEEWVRESTREQVHTDAGGLGYLWWRETVRPSLPAGVISARGAGGQFVFIAPDLDMVAVVTGGNGLNGLAGRIGGLLVRHLAPEADAAAGGYGGRALRVVSVSASRSREEIGDAQDAVDEPEDGDLLEEGREADELPE